MARLRGLILAITDGLFSDAERQEFADALRAPAKLDPDWSMYEAIKPALLPENRLVFSADLALSIKPRLAGNRLLDFGCGTARHRKIFEKGGFEWNGLDVQASLDPGSKQAAARLSNDQAVTFYDGGRVPLPSESYDVVYANQSLEHVHDMNLSFS
jgi:SAM-dependent methyltransferase